MKRTTINQWIEIGLMNDISYSLDEENFKPLFKAPHLKARQKEWN